MFMTSIRKFALPALVFASVCAVLSGCAAGGNSGGGGGGTTPKAVTISWAAPAAITNPTPLGSTQLNATATSGGAAVDGTYTYSPAAGTVLPAGTQNLSVSFTPKDTGSYYGASMSVSLTVNPAAVPQTLSLPATYTMKWADANLQLVNGTNITASSSCPPSAVTLSVVTTSKDKTNTSQGAFASWIRDTTGASYGWFNPGTTYSTDAINTYAVVGSCGTANASATLVVAPPVAITITSVVTNPAVVKTTDTSVQYDYHGTGFEASNQPNLVTQFAGTSESESYSVCPTKIPAYSAMSGTAFVDYTHIRNFSSGMSTAGTYCVVVANFAIADGTGQNWATLPNGVTVVVPSSVVVSTANSAVVTVGTAAQGQENGTITVNLGGMVTSFTAKTPGLPKNVGNLVYVPVGNGLAVVDTDRMTIQTYPLAAGSVAAMVAADDSGVHVLVRTMQQNQTGVKALVRNAAGQTTASIMRLNGDGSFTTEVSDASGAEDLLLTAAHQLLWPVPHENATDLNIYDLNAATRVVKDLPYRVNSLNQLSANSPIAAWNTGAKTIALLDSQSFAQQGDVVRFAGGVWGMTGDLGWTDQGQLFTLSAQGSVTVKGTRPVSELYNGASLDASRSHVLTVPISQQ